MKLKMGNCYNYGVCMCVCVWRIVHKSCIVSVIFILFLKELVVYPSDNVTKLNGTQRPEKHVCVCVCVCECVIICASVCVCVCVGDRLCQCVCVGVQGQETRIADRTCEIL